MTADTDSVICQRCGNSIASFSPHPRSVAILQRTARDERASVLAELETVPAEVAASWLHHRYHRSCERKQGDVCDEHRTILEKTTMNTPNPYEPPSANVDASRDNRNWFARRPIPVYIIATFCTLQFLGVSFAVAGAWGQLAELVRTGAMSPIALFGKLLYPALLFAGGVALVLLRRASIVIFGLYFAWGLAKIVSMPTEFMSYLSLSMVLGVIVYCLRLAQQSVLR